MLPRMEVLAPMPQPAVPGGDLRIAAVIEAVLRSRGMERDPRLHFRNAFDLQLASIYGEKELELLRRGRNSHRFVQNRIDVIAPEKGRDELRALSSSAITAAGQRVRHIFTVATVATSVAYHPLRLGDRVYVDASLDVVDQLARVRLSRKQQRVQSVRARAGDNHRMSDEAREAFLEACLGVRWSQVTEVVSYASALMRNYGNGAGADRSPPPAFLSEIRSSSAGQALRRLCPAPNSPEFLLYRAEVS